jgi:hypothetical protein
VLAPLSWKLIVASRSCFPMFINGSFSYLILECLRAQFNCKTECCPNFGRLSQCGCCLLARNQNVPDNQTECTLYAGF